MYAYFGSAVLNIKVFKNIFVLTIIQQGATNHNFPNSACIPGIYIQTKFFFNYLIKKKKKKEVAKKTFFLLLSLDVQ